MSIGALIKGFRMCMHQVIAVDGTHLKGRFWGTMFVATSQDGNEHVYPIAFRKRNLDFTTLCADYYKRQTLINAYSVPIIPVGHPSTWVVPSDIGQRVILNPNSKRQAGRPRAGRHVSSSERTTTQSCRRCGKPGYNSRRCPNPPMINKGTRRGVLDEYRRKCSIFHSI
ncbi:hypothetical protein Ddye_021802 [Dipteronia dyeriana]|uniref:CCHC-type domain-containing protein n=1 Tax=Dipteronia dyeriana TaxID=168575 RepID=A0AAD9WY28_9ROSI|nr:hypothetical protein Ddye_021802 [Dipteronia dyeriana]